MDNWYRVIGFGNFSGPARRSVEEAWESWENTMKRRYGIGADEMGSAKNAGSCCLVEGTTRAAVEDADVSLTNGRFKKGEWWRAHIGNEPLGPSVKR
jgi:hypothetical protein